MLGQLGQLAPACSRRAVARGHSLGNGLGQAEQQLEAVTPDFLADQLGLAENPDHRRMRRVGIAEPADPVAQRRPAGIVPRHHGELAGDDPISAAASRSSVLNRSSLLAKYRLERAMRGLRPAHDVVNPDCLESALVEFG